MFMDTKTIFGLPVILNAMYLFIDNSRPIRYGHDALWIRLAGSDTGFGFF